MSNLKKGDKVKMIDCYEADLNGKLIFECEGHSFVDANGEHTVLLSCNEVRFYFNADRLYKLENNNG